LGLDGAGRVFIFHNAWRILDSKPSEHN
jgi:hypothetical protein